jgi:hypothetical protein
MLTSFDARWTGRLERGHVVTSLGCGCPRRRDAAPLVRERKDVPGHSLLVRSAFGHGKENTDALHESVLRSKTLRSSGIHSEPVECGGSEPPRTAEVGVQRDCRKSKLARTLGVHRSLAMLEDHGRTVEVQRRRRTAARKNRCDALEALGVVRCHRREVDLLIRQLPLSLVLCVDVEELAIVAATHLLAAGKPSGESKCVLRMCTQARKGFVALHVIERGGARGHRSRDVIQRRGDLPRPRGAHRGRDRSVCGVVSTHDLTRLTRLRRATCAVARDCRAPRVDAQLPPTLRGTRLAHGQRRSTRYGARRERARASDKEYSARARCAPQKKPPGALCTGLGNRRHNHE